MTIKNKLTATICLALLGMGLAGLPTPAAARSGNGNSIFNNPLPCVYPTERDERTGFCVVRHRGAAATTAHPERSRFEKWSIEKGVFGAIDMNGIAKK